MVNKYPPLRVFFQSKQYQESKAERANGRMFVHIPQAR